MEKMMKILTYVGLVCLVVSILAGLLRDMLTHGIPLLWALVGVLVPSFLACVIPLSIGWWKDRSWRIMWKEAQKKRQQ